MNRPMVGARLARFEDPALLRGEGKFVGDIVLTGMLEAAFVRSPHPHAEIGSIDVTAASALPGVHGVFTHAHLASVLTTPYIPSMTGAWKFSETSRPVVLPADEVCFVGETLAMVVADSRYIAEDAVLLVEVDYNPLPAVSDCREAAKPNAPTVHRNVRDNIVSEFVTEYGDCEAAFAESDHVFAISLKQHRGGAHPLEPRGVVANFEPSTKTMTVWASTQTPHKVRDGLAEIFGTDKHGIHVVVPDVGGAFGCKHVLYPEDVVVAAASRLLKRPVKWIEDRSEHFLAAIQERDQYWELQVAVDDQGSLLGVRGTMIHDQGAYTLLDLIVPQNAALGVPGPYVLPNYQILTRVVETNRVGAIPVRGAGYPEGNFAMERLLDEVAGRLHLDRAEVRRRNLIPSGEMPYELPMKGRDSTHVTYDSGDFPGCQARALEAADYTGFAGRQAQALDQGRYLGIGVANMTKATGRGPFETGLVRIDRSGQVMIFTGAAAMGQGTRTTLAQIGADILDIDPEDIEVTTGDTAAVTEGIGGWGSRQTVTAGNAVHLAVLKVRDMAIKAASQILEVPEQELTLAQGSVRVKDDTDVSVSLRDIIRELSSIMGFAIHPGLPPSLEAAVDFVPPDVTYGNATHVAEVEVDAGTGDVEILRYIVVNDSGRLINPMIVEGQIQGGVAHGIGNALFEWSGYDKDARPVITTFADYLMPSATDVPNIEILHQEIPSTLNPLGVKGVGEAGTIPVASTIISAIENALTPFGIKIAEAPISPVRLVELIEASRNDASKGSDRSGS